MLACGVRPFNQSERKIQSVQQQATPAVQQGMLVALAPRSIRGQGLTRARTGDLGSTKFYLLVHAVQLVVAVLQLTIVLVYSVR